MVGDAVVQFQEGLLQEFSFGMAEEFHVGTGLAAAEHGAKGDCQDVMSWREWRRALLARGSSRALNRSANSVMAALAAIIPNTTISQYAIALGWGRRVGAGRWSR